MLSENHNVDANEYGTFLNKNVLFFFYLLIPVFFPRVDQGLWLTWSGTRSGPSIRRYI